MRGLPVNEAILDGEAIALAPEKRPLPFQTTMRRFGRKLDVEGLRGELPLTPFFFDLLYVEGQSLLGEAYEKRLAMLTKYVGEAQRLPWRARAALRAGDIRYRDDNKPEEADTIDTVRPLA